MTGESWIEIRIEDFVSSSSITGTPILVEDCPFILVSYTYYVSSISPSFGLAARMHAEEFNNL